MSIDRSDSGLDVGPRSAGSRTGTRVLTVLGSLLMLGGLVAVVIGFTGAVGWITDSGGGDRMTVLSDDRSGMTGFPEVAAAPSEGDTMGRDMALMGAGGLALVVGLGVVAFTRVAAAHGGGGYSRVTVEHGHHPAAEAAAGPVCGSCGRGNEREDRYCGGCGHVLV